MTESGDNGGTRVHPSVNSTGSVNLWVTWIVFGAAAAVGLRLLLTSSSWILGTVLAVVGGAAVLHETWTWVRARGLRKSLGKIVLTVDPHPVRIGEVLDVRLAQQVRSRIHVQSSTLRLLCAAARIETYGIRDREHRVWSRVLDSEVVVLRDLTLEAGGHLTASAQIEIQADQFRSSKWTEWQLVVETVIDDCPLYSATFPLEVISASRGRGS